MMDSIEVMEAVNFTKLSIKFVQIKDPLCFGALVPCKVEASRKCLLFCLEQSVTNEWRCHPRLRNIVASCIERMWSQYA